MTKKELVNLINKHQNSYIPMQGLTWKANRLKLENLNLDGFDFSRQNLMHADFKNCSLKGVSFKGANLSACIFSNCELAGADFTDANLTCAWFDESNIAHCVFDNAMLYRTDLSGAKNIATSNFTSASYYKTRTRDKEQEMVAYIRGKNNRIVKVTVPAEAKWCNSTCELCRTDKITVQEIFDKYGNRYKCAGDSQLKNLYYHIGEDIEIVNFENENFDDLGYGFRVFISVSDMERYEKKLKEAPTQMRWAVEKLLNAHKIN